MVRGIVERNGGKFAAIWIQHVSKTAAENRTTRGWVTRHETEKREIQQKSFNLFGIRVHGRLPTQTIRQAPCHESGRAGSYDGGGAESAGDWQKTPSLHLKASHKTNDMKADSSQLLN